jgi:phage baseplate assembly protein V
MTGMSDDVLRILTNLIRYGTVSAVVGKRVRVKVGGNTTAPLPWLTGRAGKTKSWSPPDMGEQVIVLSPNGNLAAAVVLPSLFSSANDIPTDANPDNVLLAFGDGAVLLYDAAAHLLKGTLPAGGKVELTAPDGFTLRGDVDVDGKLHVSKEVTVDSTLHASETITSNSDVKAGNISLVNHPHDKVQPGSGVSGKPVP